MPNFLNHTILSGDNFLKIKAFIILFFIVLSQNIFSQPCTPNVPSLSVDLSSSPSASWISPLIQRMGNCCGTTPPDNCLEFWITLHPDAQGIIFNVYSGAVPGGAMYYQINCGPPTPVGQIICLDGQGPHRLTFCKPGNNTNEYIITSVEQPSVSGDIVLNEGCSGSITTNGFNPSTITINSIYPGPIGTYNSFLSCPTGCTSTNVIAYSGYPPYVDYKVCGLPIGGCASSAFCDTVRVTFHSALTATLNPAMPTLCFGQTSTTINVIASGGTPPYTYTWNTGATGTSITAGVGTYTVILSDASGCPATQATATVTMFTDPITAAAGPNQIICATNPNTTIQGSVQAASGGIWSGGNGVFLPSTTSLNVTYIPTSNEVSAGVVNLILTTTGNGQCPSGSDTITINYIPFQGNPTVTVDNVNCFGGSDGSASINITNGNPPFTYIWSTTPVQTTQTATGLITGSYVATITDSYGCTHISPTQISQPTPLSAITNHNDVSCYGSSDGTASVAVYGGTPNYSYAWSNGFSGINTSGLSAGGYIVTITDANGCVETESVTINSPPQLTAIFSNFNNVTCSGLNNGNATVSVTGGTPNYSYSWTSGVSTSNTATGLSSGIYIVTVTDAEGCVTTTSVTLSQPPAFTVTTSSTNASCFGTPTGSVTVIPAGGSPPYSYSWAPLGGNNSTASNLPAGTYSVTVTDSQGCQRVGITTINQPQPLSITVTNTNNVACSGGNNGSATISVAGGTPGYNYSWSPSGGSNSTANNLSSGNYTVTVTDLQGCTAQQSVSIFQPSIPISATFNQMNASCYGSNSASISATPIGGTPPYSYFWSPSGATSSTVSNLAAGTYNVTIFDANNCTYTNSITISQPSGLQLNPIVNNAVCGAATGSASIVPSGGLPPYSYHWMPGNINNQNITNVSAGAYSVTVSDNNGCSQTAIILIEETGGISVSLSNVQNVSCYGANDGSASVSVSGGTPPYTYSWSPYGGNGSTATGLGAGVYIVTVTDVNGCIGIEVTDPEIVQPEVISILTTQVNITCFGANNGSASISVSGGTPNYTYAWSTTSALSPNILGLAPGIHNVTVTDSHGCTEQSFVNITQPLPLSVSIDNYSNISCYNGSDGSVSCLVSGGTSPYNYAWSPSGITSALASSLPAGTQTAYVTDLNGCVGSASVVLTQPPSLSIVTNKINNICSNGLAGSAWVIPTGGTPPYSYSWTPSGGTNDTASGLASGIYFITVTDIKGCERYNVVSITEPTPVITSFNNYNHVSCYNGTNGNVEVSVTGGTPGYSYLWSTGSTAPNLTGLAAGTYFVTVSDNFNCTDTSHFTINQPIAPLAVSINTQNVSCYQQTDGSAITTVTGGTPPYDFLWVPSGINTQNAFGLISGNHTLNISDDHGCVLSSNIYIYEPLPLSTQIQVIQPVQCWNTNTGSATTSTTGGTSPYTYLWSTVPIQTTPIAQNIYAGTLFVTVTDQHGCSAMSSSLITEPPVFEAYITSHTDVACHDSSNGQATSIGVGGTPPYNYLWSTIPAQNGQTAVNLPAGTYFVSITDQHGCSDTAITTINNQPALITTGSNNQVLCYGESTTITAQASGGNAPYFFYWNNGLGIGSSKLVSPGQDTEYIVTAFDNNGCPGKPDTITINVFWLFPQNVNAFATSPICPGNNSLVYASASANPFDILTYQWSDTLGSSPGSFIVTPSDEIVYYVTVTNTCGFTVVDSVPINFITPPNISFLPDVYMGCRPLTVHFTDYSTSQYSNITGWHWDFDNGRTSTEQNPTQTFYNTGHYHVTLSLESSDNCYSDSISDPIEIIVYSTPTASFSVNSTTLFIPNDPLICTNNSTGTNYFFWDFGDGQTSTLRDPIHNYETYGNYIVTLVAVNTHDCRDTTDILVKVTGDIIFPNVFTPDPYIASGGIYDVNDYSNHVFFPVSNGVSEFEMMIFNRWGELIFVTKDINVGWDGYYKGKLCEMDVYVYKAKIGFADGRKLSKVGDVLLLR